MTEFNRIEDAIEDIRKGKMVIVVDDENRENEGDLICPIPGLFTDRCDAFVHHDLVAQNEIPGIQGLVGDGGALDLLQPLGQSALLGIVGDDMGG